MDGFNLRLTVSLVFSLALLILLPTSTEAQICTFTKIVNIRENNTIGAVVATITADPGVVITFTDPAVAGNPFNIVGNQLIAATVLDYEESATYPVSITCTDPTSPPPFSDDIIVIVDNVNDNPPVFAQNPYIVNVTEMSAIGTTVGNFPATDKDKHPQLRYTLTSESNYFKLKSPTIPEVIVNATLDYDKVKNVQLVLSVHDGPFSSEENTTSSTATTTISVTIRDVDNRPPWFQPCSKYEIKEVVICESNGYTGDVFLNEQKVGALPLTPGPLYAIDGDLGINDEITYSIVSGNDGDIFAINPSTGNITMLKAANVSGPIRLTVLAAQKTNSFQFDTTTVTISINAKTAHLPQFPNPLYEGTVGGLSNMVMALDKNTPLQVLATDDDYAAAGGINPHIAYSIEGSSDFVISGGYLFMIKTLPDTTVSFKVLAKDTTNGESATTDLSVKVESGLNATTTPQTSTTLSNPTSSTSGNTIPTTKPGVSTGTTTNNPSGSTASGITTTKPGVSIGTTTNNPSGSTAGGITTNKPSGSTTSGVTTNKPSGSTTGGITTNKPSGSTTGGITTNKPSGSTASGITTNNPSVTTTAHTAGGYGVADMAALGATLGVLLFIALVVIGVLVYKMRRTNTDWRKLYDASVFRSSLGQVSGGHKEGIQYTNEAFQKDEDGGSVGSGGPDKERLKSSTEPPKSSWDIPSKEAIVMSSERLHSILPDDTSEAGSDKVENDKEVKPILTKERRVEEGYKSVWFKEDIDPNAKEEVVIIPDSREDDSEEEDDEPSTSNRDDDDEDSNSPVKTPKVLFSDPDLDSGLGVRMEDPADDSYDEVLNIDL